MTDTVEVVAGPQASLPAGRSGRLHEVPIPFGAFSPARPPDVEVLADTLDGAFPAPATPTAVLTASAVATAPGIADDGAQAEVVALPGRVIVVVGPAVAGDAAAELLATRLCRRLSRRRSEGTQLLDRHAPATDIEHWARVDALRAALVEDLHLIVCTQERPDRPGELLVTVDVPERHADRVIRAVEDLPGAGVDAVLTDQGWARPPAGRGHPRGHSASVTRTAPGTVRQVAHDHALRRSGRALVFPGQPVLVRDVPVAAVLAQSAVDAVPSVHGPYADDAVLRCHGYARPCYRDGRLTLPVAHDDPRLVVAVEVRYCPPCCGGEH